MLGTPRKVAGITMTIIRVGKPGFTRVPPWDKVLKTGVGEERRDLRRKGW